MLKTFVGAATLALASVCSSGAADDPDAATIWTEIQAAYRDAESYRGITTVIANRSEENTSTLFADRFRIALDRPTRRVGIFNAFEFMMQDNDLSILWGDIEEIMLKTTIDNQLSFGQITDIGNRIFGEVTIIPPFPDLALLLDGDLDTILPDAKLSIPPVDDDVVVNLGDRLDAMVPDANLAVGVNADVVRFSAEQAVLTLMVERESRMIRVAMFEIGVGSEFLAPKFRLTYPIELVMITSVYPEQPGWDAVFKHNPFDPVNVMSIEAMAQGVYNIHLKRIAEDIEIYEAGLQSLRNQLDAAEAAVERDERLITVLNANVQRAAKHVKDARERFVREDGG